MLDSTARRHVAPVLSEAGRLLGRAGVGPMSVTLVGLTVGLASCVAIAAGRWQTALGLWLLNRLLDGLDGAIARATGTADDFGGFVDIIADFAVYAGVIVAIAYVEPSARLAALFVLGAYYLNGAAFLAWSSLAERRRIGGDERSLVFPAGIAEGTETIVSYVVFLSFRSTVVPLLWAWAVLVALTAAQRVVFVRRSLRRPDRTGLALRRDRG